MSYCKITKQYYPASEMKIVNDPMGKKVSVHKDVETYTCDECGLEFVFMPYNWKGYNIDSQDKIICSNCRDDYFKCDECGEFHPVGDEIEIDGECFCPTCVEENYYICDECGKYVHRDDTTAVDGNIVCDSCLESEYIKCDHCERYVRIGDSYDTADDYHLCSSCYSDITYECGDCGEVFYREPYWDEDEDMYVCDNCRDYGSRCINNYSYKPGPRFRRTAEDGDDPKEYFGFEIEVEGDREYAHNFLEHYGDTEENDLYLKKDGSVDGFEIVTHPMTRNWFYEVFVPKMTRGMNFLREHHFRGHNRAGIHIHVSSVAISNTMLNKMIHLLFQKNKHNQELWLAITQRKRKAMKDWCSIDPDDIYSKKTITKSLKEYGIAGREYKPLIGSGRYLAINTLNFHTVEFRIFNSNTRPERIIKNAQVIFSLIDFTKTKRKVSMKNYLKFIEEHRKDYKELYDFLIEKHIYIPELSLERLQELAKEDNSEMQKYIQSLSATQDLSVDYDDNEGNIQCA